VSYEEQGHLPAVLDITCDILTNIRSEMRVLISKME
jgi:hypothetical protein